jgi:allantoate deiminase
MTNAARAGAILAFCRAIARCTDVPGETTRLFLSAATRDVHRLLTDRMESAGMQVRLDGAGNLRGSYAGSDPSRPPLLIGSHIDTVPNAGAFDGVLGVVFGIALVEALEGERLPFPVEVIAFSEEEGVRFGAPFIGSRALIGSLDDALLQRRDADGITVEQVLRDFGLASEPARLDSRSSYLEIHIEQGPVLESLRIPLGIVEAIAGQSRLEFRFQGAANHAGTTPMHLRRDALAAAAEWVCFVEKDARDTPGLVATVGKIEAKPGAGNVIAGDVLCSLDIRHAQDAIRHSARERFTDAALRIGQRRGIAVSQESILDQPAVRLHPELSLDLETAAAECGIPAHRMVSGAGHDAMIVAARIPAALLFIRSPGGISHHPAETVLAEDVAAALAVCRRLLERF